MKATNKQQASKILVVEGFLNQSRSLLSHLDELEGPVSVCSANDAETALRDLEQHEVSLLIVDVYLKGKMDGFDLCRAIRSSKGNAQVPIILLLGGHLSLERSKGVAAGADLLLHRPVVKEELFRMVQLLLELSALQAKVGAQRARRLHSVG